MEWVKHDSIWPADQNLPRKIMYIGLLFRTEDMIYAMKIFLPFVFGPISTQLPASRLSTLSDWESPKLVLLRPQTSEWSQAYSPEMHAPSLLQPVHYSPFCSSASAVPQHIQAQVDHTCVSSILHRCSFRLMYLLEQRNAINLDSRMRWTEHVHEVLLFIPLTHLPPGPFVVWGRNKGICILKWE